MGRKRRRDEPSGRQVIQFQQMIQNLIVGLDTAGLQRLLEAREVMSALADGRLTPQKALASMGVPVVIGAKTVKMDFFAVRKESQDDEVLDAYRRQGLRPVTEKEYRAFADQHADIVHDVVVRSRLNLIVMGERIRMPTRDPREVCWGYPVYCRSKDGEIVRYEEYADCHWDKSFRFLGVRLDRRPKTAAIPTVSLRHASPKVMPTA